jgi:large subunit ribosomal protein L21
MYAVIKTGGKQYRVQPGDLLVVEKLDGEPGANVAFGEVLMLGDGDAITVGAPTVDGAPVAAPQIETRQGEKVKIFKKIRRQGYRRTRGHRQLESVLRVTAIEGDGKSAKWDGKVDLTPKAVLDARARGLRIPGLTAEAPAAAPAAAEAAPKKATPKKATAQAETAAAEEVKAPAETEAKAAKPKKAAAPKAAKAEGEGEAKKAPPKKAAAKKDKDAE